MVSAVWSQLFRLYLFIYLCFLVPYLLSILLNYRNQLALLWVLITFSLFFCRIYATKFLGVLLRAKAHNVAHWGLDLITAQLFDPESKIVPIVALSVLDEASDDKLNLEAMVCSLQNKDLDHLGKYLFLFLFF